VLGFVSMLMDISSEMVHSLLAAVHGGHAGRERAGGGLIEGLAESTALIVKVFSGVLSDYLGKRKGLAVWATPWAPLSKPLFAMATGVGVRC
jgi:hypothetical protein